MKSRLKLSAEATEIGPAEQRRATELYREEGALWIENALSVGLVATLRDAFSERYTSLSKTKLRKRFAEVGDRRFMISVKVRPPFRSPELYANPRVMPVIRELLGPECLISSFGAVVAFPNAADQPVHFDYPPLYESPELCASLPPHAITLVVPLVDLTEETGTTAIWEGSHGRASSREELSRLAATSSMDGATIPLPKAGDVFLMDFRLIHAGTANRSESARPILYIVYSRPWFREDMNFDEQPPIRMSRKQWKRLPPDHQDLFSAAGYGKAH